MTAIDNGTVLVLNASFNPINIIPWQDAIRLLWLSRVFVIKETDIPIRSQHLEWMKPSVIALKEYVKSNGAAHIRYSKRALLERDRYRCQYIHRDGSDYKHVGKLTVDHILPISRGGKTEWENVVACCEKCQRIKGGKYLKDIPLRLRKVPTAMSRQTLEQRLQSKLRRLVKLPSDWETYIWSR